MFLSASVAAPAGASVNFTKRWVGGSEFFLPQWVATAPSGDIYVVDTGINRVLKLDPDGALIGELGSGGLGGNPGEYNGPEGVATDSAGNVYVAEANGDRVQKFDSNGNFVLMWGKGVDLSNPGDICTAASGDTCQSGTPGSAGGEFNFADAIATDSLGNVYVVDLSNRRVQKFDSSGNFVRAWGFGVATGANAFENCTVAASCQAGLSGSGNGEFNGPAGIATDAENNVYVADAGNDRIEAFTPDGSFNTKWGTTGTGPGQFNDLGGLAVDSSDNLYAADFTNANVQVFSTNGTFFRSFGKGVDHTTGGDTCTAVSGDTCGAGTSGTADGQFNGLTGVAADASGNIYTAEVNNTRVQKFDPSGAFAWKAGTTGTAGVFGGGLYELATDSAGNVYTSDQSNSRIQKFDPLGASLNAWGSPGTAGGDLSGPTGTATDTAGDVYVADSLNNRIAKYDSNGNFVLTWGKDVDQTTNGDVCTVASGHVCTAGTAGSAGGQFNDPRGIATDASGNVYVADSQNHRIQKFDSSGGFLTSWGAPGTGNGEFNRPIDVATDPLGEVYVVDLNNNRVQRFSSNGTFLGTWGTAGSGAGQFDQPISVAVDSQRNVYVVDDGNARVEVFRPTGAFIKQWGSLGSGEGQFNLPFGIAVGPAGRIYVADKGNHRVEVFTESDTTAPQTTITAGPTGATKDPTPTFSFSSSEPSGALFECRVDGSSQDAYRPCTSPKTTSTLTDGLHRFDVRAIDSAGNVDATAAAHGIKVDTHRPSSVASAPTSTHRKPFNVTYTASDPSPSTGLSVVELWARRPGQTTFRKVATDTTPNATRSFSYTPNAGAGTYRFYTRAKDKAGNYEAPPVGADATTAWSP